MSAAMRLPAVAGCLTIAGVVAAVCAHPAFQQFIRERFGQHAASILFKTLLGAYALANIKNLPGVWSIRVLRGIIYQLYFQRQAIPPKHLFAPIITQSYNTLWDTDYNLHKSNSTYFADLDVSRAHTVGAIVREGLARLNAGDQTGVPKANLEAEGKYIVALGAVSCLFQRQIEPLQAFEVYTRVLSWDRKWLYTVSHIIKKGVIKPDSYVLQPWKNAQGPGEGAKKRQDEEDVTKHIFATSLARYVFKKGRMTINPEIVLERSRLLPRRPAGVGFPPRTESAGSHVGTPFTPATPVGNGDVNGSVNVVGAELESKLAGVQEMQDEEGWTWEDMECERLRGLKLASHFDGLAACQGEFRAGDVLGKFGDYW
jgi:hypothetical protein